MQNSWTSDVKKKIDEPTETIKHEEDMNEKEAKNGTIKTPWK